MSVNMLSDFFYDAHDQYDMTANYLSANYYSVEI